MDWQEFFKEHGELPFNSATCSVEDLYQAIKARLNFELEIEACSFVDRCGLDG